MARSKFLSRKGVCSTGLKKPTSTWLTAQVFFDEMKDNKKKHPVAHAVAERWVLDNRSSNGAENQENYFKKFTEYLGSKKGTSYTTQYRQEQEYPFFENIKDMFDYFDTLKVEELIIDEFCYSDLKGSESNQKLVATGQKFKLSKEKGLEKI